MEGKRVCKDERSTLDVISTLPETVLESILCLLPTKEAAMTSVLSRDWRYKWTKISKLEFRVFPVAKRIAKEKELVGENTDKSCKPFYDLHQVLLSHQGLIHEFSLVMDQSTADQDPSGFDQVILHLSKNHTVKKLKVHGLDDFSWHNLPISIFLLRHLTHLDLTCFDLDHQPIFNGFGGLRSLYLRRVGISTKTLLHLLSNCPSLKSLTLFIGEESHIGGKDCNVIELFKCLPMIEHLTTFGYVLEWLVLDSVPRELPALLSHLKYFCFTEMWFADGQGLAFLLVLIKCSPNLEKIKLEIKRHRTSYEEYPIVWEEYSDVWLENLNILKIKSFSNLTNEMEFVKFILARSPKLKKVRFGRLGLVKLRVECLQVLLRAPRASPNLCLSVAPKAVRRRINFLENEDL